MESLNIQKQSTIDKQSVDGNRSCTIEHILSSSIQRAKEKISLMENKLEKRESNSKEKIERNNSRESYKDALEMNNSTGAIANAMKILQGRIAELEKTIEGLEREKCMILRELDNASSEKKIIITSLEETTRKNINNELTIKQMKIEHKENYSSIEKLNTQNLELENKIKELEICIKHFEKTNEKNKKDLSAPPLPSQTKMNQTEMLYKAKLKEVEDYEKEINEKEKLLTDKERKFEKIAIEEVKKSIESAEISNKIAKELELKNKELYFNLERANKEIERLEKEKQENVYLQSSNQQINEYEEKIIDLEEELNALKETKKNKKETPSKDRKQETTIYLKRENECLNEKYEELYHRYLSLEERLRLEEKESKEIRTKFWELKDLINEIISKLNKMPNAVTTQIRYLIIKINKIENLHLSRYNNSSLLETPTKHRSSSINSSKSKKKILHKLTTERNSNRSNIEDKSPKKSSIDKSKKKSNKYVVVSEKKKNTQENEDIGNLIEKQVDYLKKEYKNLVKQMNNDEDEETRNKLNILASELQEKSEELTRIKKNRLNMK